MQVLSRGQCTGRTAGFALLAAALAGWSCSGSEGGPAERPNVLVLVADDLSCRAVESFGGLDGLTPGIDRLAAGGVSFRRALCASAYCTPSRQAFLTGRWPHELGVTRLHTTLPPDSTTLGTVFRSAGYETAAIGKMHWNRRGADTDYGFDLVLERRDWRAGLSDREGLQVDRHREQWTARWNDPAERFRGVPSKLPGERLEAAWLVDRTIEFLDRPRSRPFLAFCSFSEPHYPFTYPAEVEPAVDPERLPIPVIGHEELGRNVPGIRPDLPGGGTLQEEEARALRAAYARSTVWLDRQITRLLDHVDRAGLADDTIVVLWSDHGYLLGEHGLVGKRAAFDEIVRVPLILRVPGRAPATRDQVVSLLDVFPTLCELTGVAAPAGLRGTSLVPVMEGREPGREFALVELSGSWGLVQTADWKVVIGARRGLGLDQLYDLRQDPGERRNLFGPEANGVITPLVDRMHATLKSTPPDGVPAADWMTQPTRLAAVRWALQQQEPEAERGGDEAEEE